MHVLDDLTPGAVRCVFSNAPPLTLTRLLAWGSSRPEGDRIATCQVDLAKPIFATGDDFVASLAHAALLVWPDWYDRPDLFSQRRENSWQPTFDNLASTRAASGPRAVLRPWLRQAAACCRAGTPPVLEDFSPTLQIQQLALAVAARDLVIAVGVNAAEQLEPTSLLGLARRLEWLARHSAARVVAVLPAEWLGRTELDGVSWECRNVDEFEFVSGSAGPRQDELLLTVCPIRGRPHPNSPCEQLLALHLQRDPLLGPLFEYNLPVVTARGNRYLVDLVWFAGKVAVEIDSYGFHSSPAAFANDRHRDYELQLSGYIVLRLPHDGVMDDVELALDKIRDFVHLRTGHPIATRLSV